MQDNMIGQNIIITEPCKNLRALGRNALRGYWKLGILAVLIYVICVSLPKAIMDQLFGINPASFITNDGYTYDLDIDFYNQLYNSLPQSSVLGSLYIIVVAGPFALGLCMVFLGIFRKQNVKVSDIFLGFEQFPKAIGLMLFQALFIFLWSWLFIVPGIIAAIRYSQAFFILADDPTKSITQCMNESKAMMRGNKAKYFLLVLSFIGWMLLSAIPVSLFQQIFIHATTNELVLTIAYFLSSLFLVPVTVYINSAEVGFYEILAGHLIKETQPAPVTPALQAELEETVASLEEATKAESNVEDIPETVSETAEQAEEAAAEAEKKAIDIKEMAEDNVQVETAEAAPEEKGPEDGE